MDLCNLGLGLSAEPNQLDKQTETASIWGYVWHKPEIFC